MVTKTEVLAVIPARGGSKGIPRKNIRNFAGYPLIAYSIKAALDSRKVTRVIVSTDDAEIAAVAREYGAEVPFLRPDDISQDDTTDLPVFQHALIWLKDNENYHPDVVVQLRPTSPIRPRNCVDDAVTLLLENPNADSVRGVVPAGQNPYKMWRFEQVKKGMHPILTLDGLADAFNAPRQNLPDVFWQTGHIDAIFTKTIIDKHSMSGDFILPLIIDSKYTVDIDSMLEWHQAEWLVLHANLDMVDPASRRRVLPIDPQLLILDFDGVLTDNRVWVDEEGHEWVASNRSDSMGLSLLRSKTPIKVLVLSRETNPVVSARCKKLNIPVIQGKKDKAEVLKAMQASKELDLSRVIYMGNDVNDLPCFPLVSCAIAPSDSHPDVLRCADLVLTKKGGHGAVRELCDMLLAQSDSKDQQKV